MHATIRSRATTAIGTTLVVLGLVLSMLVLAAGPASAVATASCPGANDTASLPSGYTIVLDNDTTEKYSQDALNDTVLPAGTLVCVKGATDATGIVTADGTKTLQEILGNEQDVSHYMTYTTAEEPDPLTGVQGTFICSAPADGSFELFVGGGEFVSQELNAGDYVFRFFNPNAEGVKFSAGTPAGNDNVVAEWMSLGAGATIFTTVAAPIAGVSTNTTSTDETADPVNRGTFSTNEDQVCEASPDPEPEVPDPDVAVVEGEWVDGDFECDDTTVEQTRQVTTTTTTYKVVGEPGAWEIVEDEVDVAEATETGSRTLTDAEFVACEPDVLGVVETPDEEPDAAPVAQPAPVVAGEQLPNAGFEEDMLLVLGGAFLALGCSLLLFGRRRYGVTA